MTCMDHYLISVSRVIPTWCLIFPADYFSITWGGPVFCWYSFWSKIQDWRKFGAAAYGYWGTVVVGVLWCLFTCLVVFDQIALRTCNELKKLDSIRINRVGSCFKVVYLVYSSEKVYILVWINYPVVVDVPMYVMVHPLLIRLLGKFPVIYTLYNLNVIRSCIMHWPNGVSPAYGFNSITSCWIIYPMLYMYYRNNTSNM